MLQAIVSGRDALNATREGSSEEKDKIFNLTQYCWKYLNSNKDDYVSYVPSLIRIEDFEEEMTDNERFQLNAQLLQGTLKTRRYKGLHMAYNEGDLDHAFDDCVWALEICANQSNKESMAILESLLQKGMEEGEIVAKANELVDGKAWCYSNLGVNVMRHSSIFPFFS